MSSTKEDERELAFTPAYKLVEMVKSKKLSPVELTEVILKRIRQLNPKLNAYLTVVEDEAMQAAREAEKALVTGLALGQLHGLPISIKDLQNTKGVRTTMGSLVYKDFVPDEDSVAVGRLRQAGAIIVGKTNTPEIGLYNDCTNKLGDPCRNPWNPERTAGASSGGAAASIAAGMGPLATGTDGGGSIRDPADFCGVFGLKPTNGRVPLDFKPSWGVSPITCIGPITRNVQDAALMLNVMAGPDRRDYRCIRTPAPDFVKELDGGLKKLRIAWSPDLGYAKPDPEVVAIAESAAHVFEELGHTVEEAAPVLEASPLDVWEIIVSACYYTPYRYLLDEHADEIEDYTKSFLKQGRNMSAIQLAEAYHQLGKFQGAVLDFFLEYDLLLTPGIAHPAFPLNWRSKNILEDRDYLDWWACPFSPLFNLANGNPACGVPCGFSSEGLPIGLQIVGRPEDEVTVLRAAAAFEEARPWADKRPPIS